MNSEAKPAAAGQRVAGSTQKTIGLSMIVKNEEDVIERCLASVRPLIDFALVVDTGSSDRTIEVIERYLAASQLPGKVVRHPWQDFARNRTSALLELRKLNWIDYALVIDADEVLVFEDDFSPGAFKASLVHDLYDVTTRFGTNVYLRPQLFRNHLDFHYRSALHEYLEAPPDITRAIATGFFNRPTPDGARSKDPEKYKKDAALLRTVLETEQDPFLRSRYRFYLAQSCRDAGLLEEALAEYLHRAELGYWVEEVFVSIYQAGLLMERLGRPADDTIDMLLRAHNTLPYRAEPFHAAARLLRKVDRFEAAYFFAKLGLECPPPSPNALFLDSSVYDYGLLDELQISAYWTGRFGESADAGRRLVAERKYPDSQHERMVANLNFAVAKLT